ncbi:hypothetical protein Tco_0089699 [Tanacetum coccineum]
MSKDRLIPAFDMDTKKCKTCMLTKITKKPFQNAKRKTKVLKLIHSDLCDLHATPSLENKKYFMTFIDDASREADLSKDTSGPESPPELQRSWCVEAHVRSGVISSVLMQRYQRTLRQRYIPCEGPQFLELYVAVSSYQERAPRLCLVANPK